MKKENILVVSPHIPFFDTNAADWRTFCNCKILSKKYKVYLLPLKFTWNASKYIKILRSYKIKILFPSNRINNFFSLTQKIKFKFALFEFYYTLRDCLQLTALIKKIIIDTHQLFFIKQYRKANIIRYKESDMNFLKIEELYFYKKANMLIAVNNEEQKILKHFFPKKEIYTIPTCIDFQKKNIKNNFENKKDIVFFGGFYNDQNIDGILYFIKKIFPLIKVKFPDIKLHIAGHRSEILKYYGIDNKKNVIIDNYIIDITSYLSKFKIFVCPIRYGAGMKKKILDALLSKTPVVAFRDSAKELELKNYKEIIYVNNYKNFAKKVINLYSDKNLWDKISYNGYKRVITEYTEDVVSEKLLKIL